MKVVVVVVVVTKTASRNVTFKATRMSESVLESQDEVVTRKPEEKEKGDNDDKLATLDDID